MSTCDFNGRLSQASLAQRRRDYRTHLLHHTIEDLAPQEALPDLWQGTHAEIAAGVLWDLDLVACAQCGGVTHWMHATRHACSTHSAVRAWRAPALSSPLLTWIDAAARAADRADASEAVRQVHAALAAACSIVRPTHAQQDVAARKALARARAAPRTRRTGTPSAPQAAQGGQPAAHAGADAAAATPLTDNAAAVRSEIRAATGETPLAAAWAAHLERVHEAGAAQANGATAEEVAAAIQVPPDSPLLALLRPPGRLAATIPARHLGDARRYWQLALEEVILAAGADSTPHCTSDRLALAWRHLLATPSTFAAARAPDPDQPQERRRSTQFYADDDDGTSSVEAGAVKRARLLVEQARISDAVSTLTQPAPPVSPVADTVAQLQLLHPWEAPLSTEEERSLLSSVPAAAPALSPTPLRRAAAMETAAAAQLVATDAAHAVLQEVRVAAAAVAAMADTQGLTEEQAQHDVWRIEDTAERALRTAEELGAAQLRQLSEEPEQPRRALQARPAFTRGDETAAVDHRDPEVAALQAAEDEARARATAGAALIPDIDGEQLADLVQHLPRNRAPGPSGMTAEMVTQLCGRSAFAWDSLARIIRLLLVGRAGPAPLLFASRLVALRKGARAVRPIAIGEVIVRIAGLAAQRTAEDRLRTVLAPAQYGVAIAGGTEATGWIAQLARLGGAALLNVDVANAFNSVSRMAILTATARWVPGLLPMVLWALRRPTPLVIIPPARMGQPIRITASATGVPQGWPLSPSLFALAIHDTLTAAHLAIVSSPSLPRPDPEELPREPEIPGAELIQHIAGDLLRTPGDTDAVRSAVRDITLTIAARRSARIPPTPWEAWAAPLAAAIHEHAPSMLELPDRSPTADTTHDRSLTAAQRESAAIVQLAAVTHALRASTAGPAHPTLPRLVAQLANNVAVLAAAPHPAWTHLWAELRRGRAARAQHDVPTELAAYADDVNVAGSLPTLAWAFTFLRRSFAELGMQVNEHKSKILLPGASILASPTGETPWARGELVHPPDTEQLQRLGPWLPPATEDGIDVTGTPVGTPEYTARVAGATAEATALLARRCASLPAHHASLILRVAAASMFKHVLRTTPGAVVRDAATSHDHTIRAALAAISDDSLGLALDVDGPLGYTAIDAPLVIRQATMAAHLPVRHGGFGVIAARRVAPSAYISSFCLVAALIRARAPSVAASPPEHGRDLGAQRGQATREIDDPWARMHEELAPLESARVLTGDTAAGDALRAAHLRPTPKLQRDLTRRDAERYAWRAMVRLAIDSEVSAMWRQASKQELEWRIALMARGASAYLHQVPTRRTLQLSDADIRAAYAARIGVHLRSPDSEPEQCGACGRAVPAPADGLLHALACNRNTKIFRHDSACRELAGALRLLGAKVSQEPRVWTAQPRPAAEQALRADLLVVARDRADALDLTVVSLHITTETSEGATAVSAKVRLATADARARGVDGAELDDIRHAALTSRVASAVGAHGADAPADGAAYFRYNAGPGPAAGVAVPADPLGVRACVERAEERKRAKYGTAVSTVDPEAGERAALVPLVPFVITTAGGFSRAAAEYLRALAETDVAADAAIDRGLAVAKAGLLTRAALSTAVQRGNARIWAHHHDRAGLRLGAEERGD